MTTLDIKIRSPNYDTENKESGQFDVQIYHNNCKPFTLSTICDLKVKFMVIVEITVQYPKSLYSDSDETPTT